MIKERGRWATDVACARFVGQQIDAAADMAEAQDMAVEAAVCLDGYSLPPSARTQPL